jgi:hypothetical protein
MLFLGEKVISGDDTRTKLKYPNEIYCLATRGSHVTLPWIMAGVRGETGMEISWEWDPKMGIAKRN